THPTHTRTPLSLSHTHTCAHTHIHKNTYTHTHTHTHKHRHTQTNVREFFTLYQDCINLRIKKHTTKKIINNRLLLWQRGVHGFRPLVNIHSYKRSAVVADRSSTHHCLSGKMPDPLFKKISQNSDMTLPWLYHLVLGSQRRVE